METSEAVDAAIGGQFGQRRFATGILADLDTHTGVLRWVNRAHPSPLPIRQGRWIRSLGCKPAPPMGLGLGIAPQLCHRQLQPGDRLVLYTDGVTEARGAGEGQWFGLDRFADFIVRGEAAGLGAPETLRRLIRRCSATTTGSCATTPPSYWWSGAPARTGGWCCRRSAGPVLETDH